MPFLLEASGSPGSYHVWIFLSRTKTYNAYRFIRQVKAEAGIKCEVFPKQKHLGRMENTAIWLRSPYVLIRSVGKVCILEPDTFEPIEEL